MELTFIVIIIYGWGMFYLGVRQGRDETTPDQDQTPASNDQQIDAEADQTSESPCANEYGVCWWCAGTGEIKRNTISRYFSNEKTTDCPVCDGTGRHTDPFDFNSTRCEKHGHDCPANT